MAFIQKDYFIQKEYEEMFSCRVGGLAWMGGILSVFTPDGKAYEIDDDSLPCEELWEEIYNIMEDSIKSGRNLLVEKYKDREYEIEEIDALNPDIDY